MHDRPIAARRLPRARLISMLAAALLMSAAVVPARAALGPFGFAAFGGSYTESHDHLVGAGLRASLGPIAIVPNAEYVFVDGGRHYTLNLDAAWSFLPLGVASTWIGGGIARHVTDPDSGP